MLPKQMIPLACALALIAMSASNQAKEAPKGACSVAAQATRVDPGQGNPPQLPLG